MGESAGIRDSDIHNLNTYLKVLSKPDGQINSEIITQADINIINEMQSEAEETEIEIEIEEETLDEGSLEDTDEEEQPANEIRIVVKTSSGDEKEIVIKYSE